MPLKSSELTYNVFTQGDAPFGVRVCCEVFDTKGRGTAIVFRVPLVASHNTPSVPTYSPKAGELAGTVCEPMPMAAYAFTHRLERHNGPSARMAETILNTTYENMLFVAFIDGRMDELWLTLEGEYRRFFNVDDTAPRLGDSRLPGQKGHHPANVR